MLLATIKIQEQQELNRITNFYICFQTFFCILTITPSRHFVFQLQGKVENSTLLIKICSKNGYKFGISENNLRMRTASLRYSLCKCVCVCVCVCVCLCVCCVFLNELVLGDRYEFLFNLVGTLRFVGHGFRVPDVPDVFTTLSLSLCQFSSETISFDLFWSNFPKHGIKVANWTN